MYTYHSQYKFYYTSNIVPNSLKTRLGGQRDQRRYRSSQSWETTPWHPSQAVLIYDRQIGRGVRQARSHCCERNYRQNSTARNDVTEFLWRARSLAVEEVKRKQREKFANLVATKSSREHQRSDDAGNIDKSRWVVNKSNKTLITDGHSVLEKGINFAVTPPPAGISSWKMYLSALKLLANICQPPRPRASERRWLNSLRRQKD